MNVFYNTSTRGLKTAIVGDEMQTVYFTEGTVYSICSEGALYSTPRYVDGSYDSDEWVEVDFMALLGEEPIYMEALTAIQDCLVVDAMHDPASGYYKSNAGLAVA